jgi:hypothetical protein
MTMYLGLGRNSAAFLIDVYQSEYFSLHLILFLLWHSQSSENMHDWFLLYTSQTGLCGILNRTLAESVLVVISQF